MSTGVKRPLPRLRAEQVALTERRILDAGTRLFVERGYVATSLRAVAELAGVAPRTVYVRFGTKPRLLDRCIGTSIAGDRLAGTRFTRSYEIALTAPTLEARIRALADVSRGVMDRSAALLAVGSQAAAIEPEIAAMERAGLRDAHNHLRTFAERLAADGMVPPGLNTDGLPDTLWALAGPRTMVSFVSDRGWNSDHFADWLTSTLRFLLRAG
jgi:AcrR family transcriptional regulator